MNVNYSFNNESIVKESQEFPRIMNKQEKKELQDIIKIMNSTNQGTGRGIIGYNLQYNQVKCPIEIMEEIDQKIREYDEFIQEKKKIYDANNNSIQFMEEEENDNNNSDNKENNNKDNIETEFLKKYKLYLKNRAEEEQLDRRQQNELESLDKELRQLKEEEEKEKKTLFFLERNISQTKEQIKENKDKEKQMLKEREVNFCNFSLLLEENNKLTNEIDALKRIKNYQEKAKEVMEKEKEIFIKEKEIEKDLCIICKKEPRTYFFANCHHLVIGKNCYKKEKDKNIKNNRCPFCNTISDIAFTVNLGDNI